MDSGYNNIFPKLPDVPSFDPNDLNKSSPKTTERRAGNSEFTVLEHDRSVGSETDSDTPQNIVITGKGVTISPGPEQISDFPEFPCDFNGDLPGYLLYIQDKDAKLKMFRTYTELSEYLVDATSEGTRRNRETDLLVADLLNTPLKHVAHQTTMGEYLRYLYANDLLMDVRIDVNGEMFMAHRIALCCHSNYLADLFHKSKRRRLPFDLKINGISAESFAAFLEFVYTGEVIIVPTIAADLLIIADFLRVRALQRRRSLIIDSLPLEQMLKIVATSKGSVSRQTLERFIQHILEHFSEAVQMKYFFQIDFETLCHLLASDDLVVTSEFDVYKAVVDWIFFDLSLRNVHADRLLNLVRYCYMTQDELFTCVEMTSLARDNDGRRDVFTTAVWILTARMIGRKDPFKFPVPPPRNCYKFSARLSLKTPPPRHQISPKDYPLSTPTKRSSMPSPLMTSTPIASPAKVTHKPVAKPVLIPSNMQRMSSPIPKSVDILVVGGFQTENDPDETAPAGAVSSGSSLFTDPTPDQDSNLKDQWVHYCQLPEPIQHHAVTLLNRKLFLIGGSSPDNDGFDQIPTKRVYAMDIGDKQWSRVTDMIEARYNHCACALNGKVYAVGGKGLNNRILASVECYSPQGSMWSYVSFMNTPRYAASAACLGGKLFVVGGMGEYGSVQSQLPVLSDVETFDPATNRWTHKNDLRFARCNSSLVNVEDRLFLVGGATRTFDTRGSMLISVAALDEYKADLDTWGHKADMTIPRHDAGVAVAGPRIYVIGGVSTSTDRILQSIECYDTRACAWLSGLKDLPLPSRHICCASVVSEWRKVNPNENISPN